MTIAQILPVNSIFPEILVRRVILLIVFIFLVFCAASVVLAQNAVIQVYDPQIPALKATGLLQINFQGLENNLSQPIRRELEAYYVSLLYQAPVPVYSKPERVEVKEPAKEPTSREVFKLFYNMPSLDEKAILRREWEEAFGFDVWSPYYKYKEIEKVVKKKFSVQVFKLKGEPRVEKGKIFYVFAGTF